MYAITTPRRRDARQLTRHHTGTRKAITTPNAAYWGAVCGLLAFVVVPAPDAAGTEESAVAAVRTMAARADGVIARAMHVMRHRGPDESGTWTDPDFADGDRGGVVFGFNRLSIIDIAHSHQPLRWGPPDTPDRYVLVFNGEIYNYLELRDELHTQHGAVFATDGDGEAIVAGYHHWGTDVLGRLRGMFAFALWDTVTRELFCARDPFGIKPLYMATGTGGTAVASEKKSLLDLAELVRSTPVSTLGRCSTTPSCSTCRSPRRYIAGSPGGVGLLRADPAWGGPGDQALLRTAVRGGPQHLRRRTGSLRRDHRGAGGLGGQAHARRRHRRRVLVRRNRLHAPSRRWRSGDNPRLITFTTGFEREVL